MKIKTRIVKKAVDFTGQKHFPAKKILVADDDPAIIDVLTLMLEMAGYTVYASADWQIIEDVNRICPDLILLDMFMSGINGKDICRQLKDQPSTKRIPIIMISANKDAKAMALNAYADDFIAKPFEMNKLLQKVTGYINA